MAIVYAHKGNNVRCLWNEITFNHNMNSPFFIGGDLNYILYQEEKMGGKPFRHTSVVAEIENFMSMNELHDTTFTGPRFTSKNNKEARSKIYARMDCCLFNSAIFEAHEDIEVRYPTRLALNHSQLLCKLQGGSRRIVSHWIRFEDIWDTYPMAWCLVWVKMNVDDIGNEAFKWYMRGIHKI